MLFWLIPGETARVRNHCEALGMTSEQIDKLQRVQAQVLPVAAQVPLRLPGLALLFPAEARPPGGPAPLRPPA